MTILLRQGSAGNLKDVKPLTGQAKGGTFTWTPDDSVKKEDTYAFEIKQKDQTNYTALLKGGSNPAAALPEAKDTTETGAATTTAATTGTTGSTTAPNTQTTGGTTESTQGTQTTMTSSASKTLISSAASPSGSPSGSPSSSAAASSTDSLMATRTEVVHGKEASPTESAQTGAASIPQYSVQLVMGIVGLLAYLV